MKAILMSIQPKWCELIESWKKRVEVRKSAPQEVPFKVYIYQTKKRWIYKLLPSLKDRQAKVIGEFICDKVDKIVLTARGYTINNDIAYTNKVARESCLYFDDLQKYLGENVGYAWRISKLKIYDEPKPLNSFKIACNKSIQCNSCEYRALVWHEDKKDFYYECGRPAITRPPQSWCYVEELEE